jgi:hypothetical protein
MHSLYRMAQNFVSIWRMSGAAFASAFAALVLLLAARIAWFSGGSWFWLGLALLMVLWGVSITHKAAEKFLSTRPNTPPPPRRPMSIETRKDDQRREKGRRNDDRTRD